MRKVLFIGDLHAGSDFGVAKEKWWIPRSEKYQRPLCEFLGKALEQIGEVDAVFHMGDEIDGEGVKDSHEHITIDIDEQTDIAAEILSDIKCKKENQYMVYGTPVHTAGSFSYENMVCDKLGIKRPKDTQLIDLFGMVKVNARHFVGSTGHPYTAGTPTFREKVADSLNAALAESESADVCVRGHAHYAVDMRIGNQQSIIIPCLQMKGSVYGRKLSRQYYHVGIGYMEIYGYKDWMYKPILMEQKIVNRREFTICQ